MPHETAVSWAAGLRSSDRWRCDGARNIARSSGAVPKVLVAHRLAAVPSPVPVAW